MSGAKTIRRNCLKTQQDVYTLIVGLICWFIIFDTRFNVLCWSSNGCMISRYSNTIDCVVRIYAASISICNLFAIYFMNLQCCWLLWILAFSWSSILIISPSPSRIALDLLCWLESIARNVSLYALMERTNIKKNSLDKPPNFIYISLTSFEFCSLSLSLFVGQFNFFFGCAHYRDDLSQKGYTKYHISLHVGYVCVKISTKQIIKIMKTWRKR